jgi:5-methylcytosine-specific restriction endonuclease McrA
VDIEWIKSQTLKLDAAWQPLEIISTYKAFNMCFSGRAKIVSSYGKYDIYEIPAVIVLQEYVRKFPFTLTCNRKNVFWRDNNICQYCNEEYGYKDLTMDHVVPKSQGGQKCWKNIVTSCKDCNSRKRNRTPKEANMPLFSRPQPPRVDILDLYRNIIIPDEWKIFFKEKK